MRFLSILKTVERTTPPSQEEMERMGKLVQEGIKAGWLVATEGCLPSQLGARIKLHSGNVTVTDGPFIETKEVVGGYAILNVNSREEAIELTSRFLGYIGEGECELRQMFEANCAQTRNAAAMRRAPPSPTLTGGARAVPTGPRYGGAEAPIHRRQKAIVCRTLSFGNVPTPASPTLTGGL